MKHQQFPLSNAASGPSALKRLRGWWLSPPRRGLQRLIAPYVFRHLRFFGIARIAGGSFLAAVVVLLLSCGAYGWAALFLALAAANLAGGCWFIIIARSAAPRA